jgi:SAM-dependent methyltransferase
LERAEWLQKMRLQAEALYDHIAPAYWVKFGLYPDVIHRQFLDQYLAQLSNQSAVLDAGCGAGRYDGLLLEAGHSVLGIDLSANMLARARQVFPQDRFPRLQYERMGLQEIAFSEVFDGVICIDALEHVCPEDWPIVLDGFQRALKPSGMLYVTVDARDAGESREAYKRARALGLPVVFGEVVDELDAAYANAMAQDALDPRAISGESLDHAVYHYHPSLDQVRVWFDQAGLRIEAEGGGDGYAHFLARKRMP